MRKEIFIYLLNEGTDVWRPVEAEHIKDDRYKIKSENEDPEDETWEFSKGDIVHCEEKTFSNGGTKLVAIKKA
jgi:hypothetical protein